MENSGLRRERRQSNRSGHDFSKPRLTLGNSQLTSEKNLLLQLLEILVALFDLDELLITPAKRGQRISIADYRVSTSPAGRLCEVRKIPSQPSF
jgi:hypothetical protein